MTDLETMIRVTRSAPYVAPSNPRKREYLLIAIFVVLVIAAL